MTAWQIYDANTGRVLDTIEAPNHTAAVRLGQAVHGNMIGARYESPELRELDALRAKARAVVQHCAEVAGADPRTDDLGARERILARWVIETLGPYGYSVTSGSPATSGGGVS